MTVNQRACREELLQFLYVAAIERIDISPDVCWLQGSSFFGNRHYVIKDLCGTVAR